MQQQDCEASNTTVSDCATSAVDPYCIAGEYTAKYMAPVVLAELLSDSKLPSAVTKSLSEVPLIEIEVGYWQRAGMLRAKVLAKQRKARLGDALIAQTCIDDCIPPPREIEIFERSQTQRDSILYLPRRSGTYFLAERRIHHFTEFFPIYA